MPELAEVAFAGRQWETGIGESTQSIYVHPTSRVYRDLNRNFLRTELIHARLSSVATHGKQILVKFSGDLWLGLHLGMTGSLTSDLSSYDWQKHDALVLFQNKQSLIFRDPRQFGRIRLHVGKNPPSWWSELPPSMLDEKFQKNILNNAINRHARRPIKALLLDQRYFQGMGNWMADEVLWRAKIHPGLRCREISHQDAQLLFDKIKFVSKGAMNSVGTHGGDPPKGWLFHVRWKDGGLCPVTNALLMREEIGGRTSCWCPILQKLKND